MAETILVFYFSGLVLFVSLVYLAIKGRNDVKSPELVALVVGALWFFFLPYNLIKMFIERRIAK